MTTLIDAFVVEIGLDPTAFVKGQKEAESSFNKTKDAAVKANKSVEEASKKTADGIKKIAIEALALFAIFAGAKSLTGFISDLVGADAALGRFSKNMGTTPATIAAWQAAAERAGGSAEATAATISKLSDSLMELKVNGKDVPIALRQLEASVGMRVDTDHGPIAYMNGIAAALKKLSAMDPAKAAFLAHGIGIDDATLSIMVKYGAEVGKYIDSLKGFGPTPEQVKAAQDFQEKWAAITQNIGSFAKTAFRDLAPFIQSVIDKMQQWLELNREWLNLKIAEYAEGLGKALQEFAKWISDPATLQGFKEFAETVGAIAAGVGAIAGGVKSLSSPRNSEGSLIGRGSYARPHLAGADQNDIKPGDYYYKSDSLLALVYKKEAEEKKKNGQQIDGARALGGPVSRGKNYIVGENGPEVFSPDTSGTIIPNGGGGSPVGGLSGGDTTVDGKPVNKTNPMPVEFSGGGKNWLESLEKWLKEDEERKKREGSGGGGSGVGGGSGRSSGGGGSDGSRKGGGSGERGHSHEHGKTSGGGKLVPVKTPSGKTAMVSEQHAEQFQGFLTDLEGQGYKVKSLGGYANRQNVNNPNRKSEHAHGNAIDINPAQNPNGKTLITDMPANINDLAKKWGLGWGGNWKSVKDAMHFSAGEREGGRTLPPQELAALRNEQRQKQIASLPPIGAAASMAYSGGTTNNNSQTSSHQTQIGKIVVHTQAKDAEGIAKTIGDATKRQGQVATSNYGPK